MEKAERQRFVEPELSLQHRLQLEHTVAAAMLKDAHWRLTSSERVKAIEHRLEFGTAWIGTSINASSSSSAREC